MAEYNSDRTGANIDALLDNIDAIKDKITPTGTGAKVNGNLSFDDNDKILLGNSGDFEIYHEGADSIIRETGSGALSIRGTNVIISDSTDTTKYFTGIASTGQSSLFYGGSQKFKTTATGVDVTGTLSADSISVGDGHTIGNDGFDNLEITSSTSENIALKPSGSTYLYNAGSAKLTTTATGVDVTGTITADGLDNSGVFKQSGALDHASSGGLTIKAGLNNASISNSTDCYIGTHTSGGMGSTSGDMVLIPRSNANSAVQIVTGNGTPTKTATFSHNGDVSFYEDTGTTAKMVWDASAESLGIGTASPTTKLDINGDVSVGSGSTLSWGGAYGAGIPSITGLSGGLRFYPSGSTSGETMRIDSSGNVGIGAIPTTKLDVNGLSVYPKVKIQASSNTSRFMQLGMDDAINYSIEANGAGTNLLFKTVGTERARIDSSGNLLVGTTTGGLRNSGAMNFTTGTDAYSGVLGISHSTNNANGSGFINFSRDNAYIGSISQSGTTGVSYNTTSDERLKENIKDTTHVVNIDDIKVREYDWKVDGEHQRFGFIAQELETVYPEAVHSPDDSEEMKSVDYSKLVPLLVKEMQTLKARIEELEK